MNIYMHICYACLICNHTILLRGKTRCWAPADAFPLSWISGTYRGHLWLVQWLQLPSDSKEPTIMSDMRLILSLRLYH